MYSAITQREAQGKLEAMYREIDTNWGERGLAKKKKFTPAKDFNPFSDVNNWSDTKKARYKSADEFLGREFLIIAMYASAFTTAMNDDPDLSWEALRNLVHENRYSLRMFALMRRLEYVWYYSRCPLAAWVGNCVPYYLYNEKKLPHVHEVYLSATGDIKLCEFTNEVTKIAAPIHDKTENEFDKALFRQYPRPETWPEGWKYPWDPQYGAESETGPWNPCNYCDGKVVPNIAFHSMYRDMEIELCRCTKEQWIENVLVEIREYPNSNYNSLNRGVRALSSIPKGAVIAEYVGKLFPLPEEETCGDKWYLLDFNGPPHGEDNETLPATAFLASGLLGNWSRFMNDANHPTNPQPFDVEFQPEIIGKKQRIVVRSKRDIPFGKEILTLYGANYWEDQEDGDLGRRKGSKRAAEQLVEAQGESRQLTRTKSMSGSRGVPYPPPGPSRPQGAQGRRNWTAKAARKTPSRR